MKTMNDSITDLLLSYFRGEADETRKRLIMDWYEESEDHKKTYWECHGFYEAHLMQAPLESLEGRPARPLRKRMRLVSILKTAAYAAAVLIFCLIGYNLMQTRIENRLASTMNTVVIPAGRSMDYILPDGTSIKLNSGATLQYPMAFAKDRREVRLEGEAYFDVARNPEQPFVVKTYASDVEVLGTRFNVNADEDKGTFSTSLIEGSVRLTGALLPEGGIIMIPDQTVTLSEGRFITENKPAKSAALWTRGILEIRTDDFTELTEKLEMAFGVEIIIEKEPEFDFIQGKFRLSDGIGRILDVLGETIGFTYRKDYKTGTIYIR